MSLNLDLSKNYPASVKQELFGIVQLERTLDKAKAKAHGNIGEYHYNCPMDQALFEFLGIDQAELLERVSAAQNDAEIENYLRPFVEKKSAAELQTWNKNWLSYSPAPGSDSEKFFLELRSSVAPDRTDVTAWADVLDLDEKRPVPQRVAA